MSVGRDQGGEGPIGGLTGHRKHLGARCEDLSGLRLHQAGGPVPVGARGVKGVENESDARQQLARLPARQIVDDLSLEVRRPEVCRDAGRYRGGGTIGVGPEPDDPAGRPRRSGDLAVGDVRGRHPHHRSDDRDEAA